MIWKKNKKMTAFHNFKFKAASNKNVFEIGKDISFYRNVVVCFFFISDDVNLFKVTIKYYAKNPLWNIVSVTDHDFDEEVRHELVLKAKVTFFTRSELWKLLNNIQTIHIRNYN